jgi:hypothetical protein
MSTGINPDPYTEEQLKKYIQDVEEHEALNLELERLQRFLQKLHKPDFFVEYPNETKESCQKLVYKFSQLFRVLLARREQKRQKVKSAEARVPVSIEY